MICGCTASLHGHLGCREEAWINPEDGTPGRCNDCRGYEVTGVHFSQYRRTGYDRDLIEATVNDQELMKDEFPGWSEAELREAFGR